MVVKAVDLFVTPPEVLKSFVQYCIPKDLIPSTWECTHKDPLKNLEDLLKLSKGALDRYGSNTVLLFENLKSFSTFSGCWSFFKIPKTVVYTNNVPIHFSLGKTTYVYKRDMYGILQSCIKMIPLSLVEAEIAVSMVSYFLKVQEEKVNASEMAEMIPMMFAALKMEIDRVNDFFVSGIWKSKSPTELEFDKMPLEDASAFFVQILHCMDCEEGDGKEILELLKKYSTKLPMTQNSSNYNKILTWVGMVTVKFQNFIDRNAEFMKTAVPTFNPAADSKVAVRLFKWKDQKFVLAHELFYRMMMGGFDIFGLDNIFEGRSEVDTLTFREVFELVPKELMKNIEFIVTEGSKLNLVPLISHKYALFENGKMLIYTEDTFVPKIEESNQFSSSTSESDASIPVRQYSCESMESSVYSDTPESIGEDIQEEKKQLEKPKKKKVKTQKKKKEPAVNVPKPVEKESESCQKCFRASTFTQKANEKLRLEKIATKQLRKQLAEMEMENLEKDEKIRNLMMLVESQKKELEEKDEVIMSQKEVVKELQVQLVNKSEVIEDLESAISMAPVQEVPEVPEVNPEVIMPTRSHEETEKVRDVLFELLNTRAILQREKPIPTVLTMTNRMMYKTNNTEVRRRSRFETHSYREACSKYTDAVESNLAMIRANQQITADQIPELPVFPTLSQWFQDAYKETMKLDAPKLCESLIKAPVVDPNELADKECLICLEQMNTGDDTTKCECCKRRYHGVCIKEWFKTKRMCPTCNSGMLDSEEFPAL